MSVIVFGPGGVGKSHHAEALRRHFGLSSVTHEWDGREPMRDSLGTLVLTSRDLSGRRSISGFRVIAFADAMREAGLTPKGEH